MTGIPPLRLLRATPFLAMLGLLVLAAFTGGASRYDVSSLVVLRPVAAILLGIGLLGFTRDTLFQFRFLFAMMAAAIVLVGIQLIPLPPAIWTMFPGRDMVSKIDTLAGVGEPWRPITLTIFETWNALYSLIVPLTALVLFSQVSREQRYNVLVMLLVIGVVSGVLGVMQVIGPPAGPLYFYRVTNFTSAVGLFSNRNHQAVFLACLFPMLAVFASTRKEGGSLGEVRTRAWLALGIGALLVPLLLVTGSRLGLVLGLIGIASTAVLVRRSSSSSGSVARNKRKVRQVYLVSAGAIVALIAVTVMASRAEAIKRLFSIGDDESRFPIWQSTAQLVGKFFPVGSGYGSFAPVFQIAESDGALDQTFTNHAHNELLEIALTGGILGLLLIAIGVLAWARASWWAFSTPMREGRSVQFARLGSVVLFILGVASVTDYPLRTPLLACVFVVACVWLTSVVDLRGGPPSTRLKSE